MERSTFFDLACENVEEENQTSDKQELLGLHFGKIRQKRGWNEAHGRYTVFFTDPIWNMSEKTFFEVRQLLSEELFRFLSDAWKEEENREKLLLVAGLGNPNMTADALGARVVDRVDVTRKIREDEKSPVKLCAVSLGVLGTTGIETFEHVDALCRYLHPSAVLTVDALSAKSQSHVGAAIQISSGGISPGGGVGRPQKILSSKTLGVPVVSIGIPTVVRSSVMIREAMAEMGVRLTQKEQQAFSKDSFFMMPKECDLLLQSASLLLSSAIGRVGGFF